MGSLGGAINPWMRFTNYSASLLLDYCGTPRRKMFFGNVTHNYQPVWPDWAIFWTLGNFSKPVATSSLPKSTTFLGNFCKDAKIFKYL